MLTPTKSKSRRDTTNHNHTYSDQVIYYGGYSEKAPQYHIWRCSGKEGCPVTMIVGCPERMHLPNNCKVCGGTQLKRRIAT